MTARPTNPRTLTSQMIFDLSYLKNARDTRHLPAPQPRFFSHTAQAEWPLPGRINLRPGDCRGLWSESYVSAAAHYTLGLTRYEPTEPYSLHRPTPAPRCLHSTELYLTDQTGAAVPPGTYRYNPVRHTLQPASLRCAESTAPEQAWTIEIRPERLAHIYGQFALRLALLEAGHVMEHLQVLSAHLGHALRVQPCPDWQASEGPLPAGQFPLAQMVPGHSSEHLPLLPAAALLGRHSGHGPQGIDPFPVPVPLATLQRVTASLRLIPQGGVQVFAAVLNVPELDPGVYAACPETGGFRLIALGVPAPEVLFKQYGFQARHCAVTFFLCADLSRASWPDAQDPYAGALLACARLAQRLGWGAAQTGLFARPHLSHDEAAVDHALGLTTTSLSAVYAVALGTDRDRGFPVKLHLPLQEDV